MGSYEQREADKVRLWDHVLTQAYGTPFLDTLKELPPDPEGHAFFRALDMAFSPSHKMGGCVPVDRDLLLYLAGWGAI